MNTDKIMSLVDLLLFLNESKEIDMSNLTLEFSKNYQTLYKIIKDFIDEGLIQKEKKDRLFLGGYKYNFSLSDKGQNFLREIYVKIGTNFDIFEKSSKKKRSLFGFGKS